MKKLLLLFGVLSTSGFLFYSNWPIDQPERLMFSVIDLGAGVRPLAINNRGEILLWAETREVIRHPDGATTEVRIDLPGPHRLVALNDVGEVLGRTNPSEGNGSAFVWSKSGGVRFLPEEVHLEHGVTSRLVSVHSLNNEGEIGVTVGNDTGFQRGILKRGEVVLPVSSRSVPRMTPGGTLLLRREVLFPDGRTQELPRDYRRRHTQTESHDYIVYPTGLNDQGKVVGFAFHSDADYRRMRGSMQGRPETSRGDPPPDFPETGYPFVLEAEHFLDLNLCIPPDTPWSLRWPSDINNSGQIIGYGVNGETTSGFLLEPIEADGAEG